MSPAAGPRLERERLRPVYVLLGDETYFRDQFTASLAALAPEELREFCLFHEDLATTPLEEILDRARTPSLMAPLQVFFIRNARDLVSRAAAAAPDKTDAGEEPAPKARASKRKHGDFPANVAAYAAAADTPANAVLLFYADHIHLPSDRQRMSLDDKGRLQRLETAFGAFAEMVYCARLGPAEAAAVARQMALDRGATLAPDAARELAEMLEGNLGLMRPEVEKLALYTPAGQPIGREQVTKLVTAARAGSGFDLAHRLARGERAAALDLLGRIWSDAGDSGAIGLVFQLSRVFAMALVLREQRVSDRSGVYRVLPEGLRPPGFAADTVLAVSRALPAAKLTCGLGLLRDADVKLRSSPPSARLIFEQICIALTA